MDDTLAIEEEADTRLIDRRWFQRMLEIIPGAFMWMVLLLPFVLSFFLPVWVAYFIIAFDLYWMFKSFRLSSNLIRGYHRLHRSQKINWNERLDWLRRPESHLDEIEQKLGNFLDRHPGVQHRWSPQRWNRRQAKRYRALLAERAELQELVAQQGTILNPDKILNAVIIATYNESKSLLENSIKALEKVNYPLDQLIVVLAYEERGGPEVECNAKALIAEYGSHFRYAEAVKHPDGMVGEVIGKGGNITFAGRRLLKWTAHQGIEPERVIVTTLDADHEAGKEYFALLSYEYATTPNRSRKSFQPIPMFYNNIWDAPAAMRVIAIGNSFWTLMETMRPRRLRNFAAHAQGLQALITTDFWSVSTIVEDGHQFWRSYFAYEGDHQVIPIYEAVYQDAVMAETYWKTVTAQFKQLQRWAWGVSDFPYAVRNSIRHRRIPWSDKLVQIGRLVESHLSWATASLFITFVAWGPLYLNHNFDNQVLAHQLPVITGWIIRVTLVGLVLTIFISLISLPPRPARYRRSRSVLMLLQWILFPVTSLAFGSLAAINAQTRLMLNKSLNWQVTPKARRE